MSEYLTAVPYSFTHEDGDLSIFIGSKNFLKNAPEIPGYARLELSRNNEDDVPAWYGDDLHSRLMNTIQRALRMRPDNLIFSYEDLFASSEIDPLVVDVIYSVLKAGHKVVIVYDPKLSPGVPSRLDGIFPN